MLSFTCFRSEIDKTANLILSGDNSFYPDWDLQIRELSMNTERQSFMHR